MPLSFHIDCTYKWDQVKQFLASPHVKTAFLMNASVEQVQYALQHCEFVVVRFYDIFNERNSLGEDFEKSIVNRRPGSDFVNWLNNSPFKVFKGNKSVRFVLSWNELYSKRGQAEREQNTRIVAIGQAIVNAGYGVGLGAWAADKSFYADDVNAGHWDNVIRFAVDHKDMVSIDCHEYDVLTIFAGHLKQYPDGFPDTLKTAIALDPNNHKRIPYSRDEGNIETNYKIGRIALLLQRSIDITGQHFNWYRGECALDFKDDGSLKQLMDTWYKPRFGHPTGINTLQDYYRHVLGDSLTNNAYDELIFRQHTDLAEQDPPSNQGNFIFAWNGDVLRWLPFDVSQRPYFVQLVQNYQEDTQPMPDNPFDTELTPHNVYVTNGYLNVRSEPSSKSAERNFDIEETPKEMLFSIETTLGIDDINWHKLEYEGVVGYVAAFEKLRFDRVVDTPPDTGDGGETPDTDAPTIAALKQEVADLKDALAEMKSQFSSLEARIARELELVHIDVPYAGGIFTYSIPRFALKAEIANAQGAKEWQQQNEDSLRRADGQVLAKDMADDTFIATTTPDPDDYFSVVAHDETLTDIIYNEDTEDDNAA